MTNRYWSVDDCAWVDYEPRVAPASELPEPREEPTTAEEPVVAPA